MSQLSQPLSPSLLPAPDLIFQLQEQKQYEFPIRLAFPVGDGAPYILPLNFGFVREGEKRVFYFHSAKKGRKLDLARERPLVGFELDRGGELVSGPAACDYAYRFQSVIGTGRLELVEDEAERLRGLGCLMGQYTGRSEGWDFSRMLAAVEVLRLTVEELSCKEHE